ncbi:putative thrombospondin type 1 domain-containing protein [Cryptosporidium felis]|nr:putative thrombospondin type 1 domain-containing protein [Cryptosporidium felis]
MKNILRISALCYSTAVLVSFSPFSGDIKLVSANKVDLNQIERNERLKGVNRNLEHENEIPEKVEKSFEDYANTQNSDLLNYFILENNRSSGLTDYGNKHIFVNANGSISSEVGSFDTNDITELDKIPKNQTQRMNNEHEDKISENNGLEDSQLDKNQEILITNSSLKYNEQNFESVDYSLSKTIATINSSYNVFCTDFSTIYEDLLFDPNLRSIVEYTIFNTSNDFINRQINLELKTSNTGKAVINVEDLSSFGFINWIKPLESNSSEVTLQLNSGIMSERKIKKFKKFFPRRNFTNDELDVVIISETKKEIRPYGFRGSPIILTQFIENIDGEDDDIFSIRETIEALNQTHLISNQNNDNQNINTTSSNDEITEFEAFEQWNSSFLLHDNPKILSINCDYYGEWSSWSSCSNGCGWGIQTRGRKIDAKKIDSSKEVVNLELDEKLKNCKVQIQTQGCTSRKDCCLYGRPKESLWVNCTATCNEPGIEKQVIELISNKKGSVKDLNCKNKKTISRKCKHLSGIECEACNTSDWSEWSACIKEDGNLIKKRTRYPIDINCTKNKLILEEKKICDNLPTFSNSPINNNSEKKNKGSLAVLPESSINNHIHIIEECNIYKSEAKYDKIEGACKCPDGIKLCDNSNIENNKSSWESFANEICERENDVLYEKAKVIMAREKKVFNCKSKTWEKYAKTLDDSYCKDALVLCKLESECVVSNWSEWSGCSAPCKLSHLNNPDFSMRSTKFKTRKVISGECNEHTLFKSEECTDLVECPQTKHYISTGKTSTEFIDIVYSEEAKKMFEAAFIELRKLQIPENTPSNVIKFVFADVRDLIIQNSQYIRNLDLESNVFSTDGMFHKGSFIKSILSTFKFDDLDLVTEIVSWASIPSDVDKEELYTQLSPNDRGIIGSNKTETNAFLNKVFPSNDRNRKYYSGKHEQMSGMSSFDVNELKSNFISSFNRGNLTLRNHSEPLTNSKIDDGSELNKINISNTDGNELQANILNQYSATNNTGLSNKNIALAIITNSKFLYELISTAVLINTKCIPMGINRQISKESSETNCICPSGYSLCSSVDYYFGNRMSSISNEGAVNIRDSEGVFSDDFVLNKGGLFEQVYKNDKENYCKKPGAKVMCNSNSELVKEFKNLDIKDLFLRFVGFINEEKME